MGDFNPLCIDLAGLSKAERRLMRLHHGLGLPVADIAEAMEMVTEDVRRALASASAKYRRCYDGLGFRRAKKIQATMSVSNRKRP